jgi:hypothetical protein
MAAIYTGKISLPIKEIFPAKMNDINLPCAPAMPAWGMRKKKYNPPS